MQRYIALYLALQSQPNGMPLQYVRSTRATAKHLGVARQTVVRCIDKLKQDGWIVPVPAGARTLDPTKRKPNRYALVPKLGEIGTSPGTSQGGTNVVPAWEVPIERERSRKDLRAAIQHNINRLGRGMDPNAN